MATGTGGERAVLLAEPAEAAAAITDGALVGIGGFLTGHKPMAVLRAVLERGVEGLHVAAPPTSLETDLLVAEGAVDEVTVPYVGAEALNSIAPFFRARAEAGTLAINEADGGMVKTGLEAGARRLPSLPWWGGVGTSIVDLNDELVEVDDPVTGERVVQVPAIAPDVALLHADRADPFGNVQADGDGFVDVLLARAADTVIVQVEEVVSNHEVRSDPTATILTSANVDYVVPVEFGAHPFSCEGRYLVDAAWVESYVDAATAAVKDGDRARWDRFVDHWVREPADHAAYLERVGYDRLASLREQSPTQLEAIRPPEAAGDLEEPATARETMAAFIARQLADGEVVGAGTNSFIPRTGAILAHRTRAPNMKILLSSYVHNFVDSPQPAAGVLHSDGRYRHGAEAPRQRHLGDYFDHAGDMDAFFVGGIQIDRFGNTNMIGIPDDDGGWAFRGPGAAGATSLSAEVGRYYVFTTSHTPRTLVESCDLVSTLGPRARREYDLPGGGPQYVITPKAVLSFGDDDALQLHRTIGDASVEEVQERTGFGLPVADDVRPVEPPDAAALRLIRTTIDREGRLRG